MHACRAEANKKKYAEALHEKEQEKEAKKKATKQLKIAHKKIARFARKQQNVQGLKRSLRDLQDADHRREVAEARQVNISFLQLNH